MKNRVFYVVLVILLVIAASLSGIRVFWDNDSHIIPTSRVIITMGPAPVQGDTVSLDRVVDATDAANVTATINELITLLGTYGGGTIKLPRAGNYALNDTPSLTDNITIEGIGKATYFYNDGSTPIFNASTSDGCVFRNFATDGGNITRSSATNYIVENVHIGPIFYAYMTEYEIDTYTSDNITNLVSSNITSPIGKASSVMVASSSSLPRVRAQAEYLCSDTANDVEIAAAFASLTAGRSSKEKAILSGNFTLADEVELPSYIIVEIQGSVTQGSADAKDVFTGTGLVDVEVFGGEIIGNRTGQAEGSPYPSGISLSSSDLINIHDTVLSEMKYFGIDLVSCTGIQLDNISGYNIGAHLIALNKCDGITGGNFQLINGGLVDAGGTCVWINSRHVTLSNAISDNSPLTCHIEAYDQNNYDINVTNVCGENNTRYALKLGATTGNTLSRVNVIGVTANQTAQSSIYLVVAGTGVISDFSILAPHIYGSSQYAIRGDSSAGAGQITRGNILGGTISGSTYSQLSFDGLTDSNISFLDVRNGASNGIIFVNSSNNTFSNNTCTDDQGVKTQTVGINESTGSNYNRIYDNNLEGNKTSALTITGANTVYRDNIGYLTKNSGSSVGTGAQQTIAHGLDITPDRNNVIVVSDNFTGVASVTAAPDATNIYVTSTNNSLYHWAVIDE